MKRTGAHYLAGWNKQEFYVKPEGHAMHGYGGMNGNRAYSARTPLYARAVYLCDAQNQKPLMICCLDLAVVSYALRSEVVRGLTAIMAQDFDEAALVLTCTHTHSGPGGLTYDAYYNVPTPGFLPGTLKTIARAAIDSVTEAWRSAAETEVTLARGPFADDIPVAWNRALDAYNRNPEIKKFSREQAHLAIDREMQVLGFKRNGKVRAFISLFGVHATCIGNAGRAYCGDNKGFASAYSEKMLAQSGGSEVPVAIFAQATAGDVSPHYRGPGDAERRKQLTGEAEYEYAEENGKIQAVHALALVERGEALDGQLDSILTYVDLSDTRIDPPFADGVAGAETFEPCIGVSMLGGKALDGAGMAPAVGVAAQLATQTIKTIRQSMKPTYDLAQREYVTRLYKAQGKKDIVIEGKHNIVLGLPIKKLPLPGFADPLVAELKGQASRGAIEKSALLPAIMPLQIVSLGSVAIVCVPGEFTTTAGARLKQTMARELDSAGIKTVLINSYCNDYMGYATTREEYELQQYEGGHTLYGQWTLAAFQTHYSRLAREFVKAPALRAHDQTTRPEVPPAEELALRSNLPVPQPA